VPFQAGAVRPESAADPVEADSIENKNVAGDNIRRIDAGAQNEA
jgi:hypothetical protein